MDNASLVPPDALTMDGIFLHLIFLIYQVFMWFMIDHLQVFSLLERSLQGPLQKAELRMLAESLSSAVTSAQMLQWFEGKILKELIVIRDANYPLVRSDPSFLANLLLLSLPFIKDLLTDLSIIKIAYALNFIQQIKPKRAARLLCAFATMKLPFSSWLDILLSAKDFNFMLLSFIVFCLSQLSSADKASYEERLFRYMSTQLTNSLSLRLPPTVTIHHISFSDSFLSKFTVKLQTELFEGLIIKTIVRQPEVNLLWFNLFIERIPLLLVPVESVLQLFAFRKSSDEIVSALASRSLYLISEKKECFDSESRLNLFLQTVQYINVQRPPFPLKIDILKFLATTLSTRPITGCDMEKVFLPLIQKETNEKSLEFMLELLFSNQKELDDSLFKWMELSLKAEKYALMEVCFCILVKKDVSLSSSQISALSTYYKKLSLTESATGCLLFMTKYLPKDLTVAFLKSLPSREKYFVKVASPLISSSISDLVNSILESSFSSEIQSVLFSLLFTIWNICPISGECAKRFQHTLLSNEKTSGAYRLALIQFLKIKASPDEALFSVLIQTFFVEKDTSVQERLDLLPCVFKLKSFSARLLNLFEDQFLLDHNKEIFSSWLKAREQKQEISAPFFKFIVDNSDLMKESLLQFIMDLFLNLLTLAQKISQANVDEWQRTINAKKPSIPSSIDSFFSALNNAKSILDLVLGNESFAAELAVPTLYEMLLPFKTTPIQPFTPWRDWMLKLAYTYSKAFGLPYPYLPVRAVISFMNGEALSKELSQLAPPSILATPFLMLLFPNDVQDYELVQPIIVAAVKSHFLLRLLSFRLIMKITSMIVEFQPSLIVDFCKNYCFSVDMGNDVEELPFLSYTHQGCPRNDIGDFLLTYMLYPNTNHFVLKGFTFLGPKVSNQLLFEWNLMILARNEATRNTATLFLDAIPRCGDLESFLAVIEQSMLETHEVLEVAFGEAYVDFVLARGKVSHCFRSLLNLYRRLLNSYLESPKTLRERFAKDLLITLLPRKRIVSCLELLIATADPVLSEVHTDLFNFINECGLLDPSLSSEWLMLGTSYIKRICADSSFAETLFQLFNGYLDRPSIKQCHPCWSIQLEDSIRMSNSMFLGALGEFLSKDRVPTLIERLLAGLDVPSETVQLAVAKCILPLAKLLPYDTVEIHINDLLDALKSRELVFALRKAKAFGLAAFLGAVGIQALDRFGIIAFISEPLSSSTSSSFEKLSSLVLLEALLLLCDIEPYLKTLLPLLLNVYTDSDIFVREVAMKDTSLTLIQSVSPFSLSLLLPSILDQLRSGEQTSGKHWRRKLSCVHLLSSLAYLPPAGFSRLMPAVIPAMLEHVLTDSHPSVSKAGYDALVHIFMNNDTLKKETPEIDRLLNILLLALSDPNQHLAPAIQSLCVSVFSHYISFPAVCLITPILERGLLERSSEIKRKTCLIIGNFLLLVKNTAEVRLLWKKVASLLVKVLVDPVPDTREMAANALGVVVHTLGPEAFFDASRYSSKGLDQCLLDHLLQELRSNSSSVDRSGLAQGLIHSLFSLGTSRLHGFIQSVLVPLLSSPLEYDIDSGIVLLHYMPPIFGLYTIRDLSFILPLLLRGFDSGSYFVNDERKNLAIECARRWTKSFASIDRVMIQCDYGNTRFFFVDEKQADQSEKSCDANRGDQSTTVVWVAHEFLCSFIKLLTSREVSAKLEGLSLFQLYIDERFPLDVPLDGLSSQPSPAEEEDLVMVSPASYLSPSTSARISQINAFISRTLPGPGYTSFLAKLYLLRFDSGSHQLRQLAMVLWKNIIAHTPRTLKSNFEQFLNSMQLDISSIAEDLPQMRESDLHVASNVGDFYPVSVLRRAIQDLLLKINLIGDSSMLFSYIDSKLDSLRCNMTVFLLLEEWINLIQKDDASAGYLALKNEKQEKLAAFLGKNTGLSGAKHSSSGIKSKLDWIISTLKLAFQCDDVVVLTLASETLFVLYAKLEELYDTKTAFSITYGALINELPSDALTSILKNSLLHDMRIMLYKKLVPFIISSLTSKLSAKGKDASSSVDDVEVAILNELDKISLQPNEHLQVSQLDSLLNSLKSVIECVPERYRALIDLSLLSSVLLQISSPQAVLIWNSLLAKQLSVGEKTHYSPSDDSDVDNDDYGSSTMIYYSFDDDYVTELFAPFRAHIAAPWSIIDTLLDVYILPHPYLQLKLPLKTTAARRMKPINGAEEVRFKESTFVNACVVLKSLITTSSNVCPLTVKQFQKILLAVMTLLCINADDDTGLSHEIVGSVDVLLDLLKALFGFLKKNVEEEVNLHFLFFLLESRFEFSVYGDEYLKFAPSLLILALPLLTHLLSLHEISGEMKIQATSFINDAFSLTDASLIQPSLVMLAVGPFIRCLSEKIQQDLRSPIISTLLLVLQKYTAMVKPFVPQLMRCFVKSLVPSSSTTSSPTNWISGSLIPGNSIECLLCIAQMIPKPDVVATDLFVFLKDYLYPCLQSMQSMADQDSEGAFIDADVLQLTRNFKKLIQCFHEKDASFLEKEEFPRYLSYLESMSILKDSASA